MSKRDSPELLFDIMGFGQSPDSFDDARVGHLQGAFGPSLELVAETLGLPLDGIEAVGEVATVSEPLEIAAGTIEAGTVAGMRTTVSGMRDGTELLRFRANWYCSTDLDADWELQATGWRVNVEGDTPLDVSLRFPVTLDQMAATTPGYTAHRAVNCVEPLCAATPGIRTSPELPQIIATLG